RSKEAQALLEEVGLTAVDLNKRPKAFSGGQRQRIGIARALAAAPEVLICDESVSALDVSVQSQVLNVLNGIKKNRGLSMIFISHDPDVIRYMCDRVVNV
ncbi:MAG: ABC transporter ATP-binding protein, partial [Bacteroidetes bacterium]|nr:ABC transporter ATP-binding protein [Bacteroidota bacterium]